MCSTTGSPFWKKGTTNCPPSGLPTSVLCSRLTTFGIENRLDHLPSQLSGGQQQRVAIARALAGKPKLLLCDEPTGNLDTENSRLVMDLLERLQEAFGLTMVVVTHNQELACRFPRVLSMADGLLAVILHEKRFLPGLSSR